MLVGPRPAHSYVFGKRVGGHSPHEFSFIEVSLNFILQILAT